MESWTKSLGNQLRTAYLNFEYMWWNLNSHKKLPETFHNILVVEMKYLGDVIAITPALRGLKQKYPQAEITVWTLPNSVYVLAGNPNVNHVITQFDDKQYDLLVVFHAGTNWDMIDIYQATKRIPFKIGVTRAGVLSSHFTKLDRMVKYPSQFKHTVEDNLDVVRLIGVAPEDKRYEVYTHILCAFSKPTVILHPGSKNVTEVTLPSHIWPIERWVGVARYLVDKGYDVEVTGQGDESLLAEWIREKVPEVINQCNKLTVPELIAHIKAAEMMVSIDTGPAHIAAAVGTPLVMLMGPQDPIIWGPWTNKAVTLFHDEVCTKCKRLTCGKKTQECMNAISTEEVIQSISKLKK
jgi:ADP-heptose:LPS heptosyltransferase